MEDDDSFLSEDVGSVDSEEAFNATLQGIRENDPNTDTLGEHGEGYIDNFTDEAWEELGRDISNNTHLTTVDLYDGALNEHKMSIFFRGLTRSISIEEMRLFSNGLSALGVRSMVPFLQNANNLTYLKLSDNNIQSEGFNLLVRALRNSPIKELHCRRCEIESIEIDRDNVPKHLESLTLENNGINADGCRELAKLLEGEDDVLTELYLAGNKIDDQGVNILVDALQNNTSLMRLTLFNNDGISDQGQIMLLKLVNNISSIEATFQSNHTLEYVKVNLIYGPNVEIQQLIDVATCINVRKRRNSELAVGKEKVIQTQLNSGTRAELAELQGVVSQSLYSEISPLHLPEVLALVCRHHGQGELFVALKSSIVGVISTVNRKQCLLQQKAHHEAAIAEHRTIIAEHRTKVETIEAEIEAIEEADGSRTGSEPRSSKRRRV